jgi:hypothetical protein
MMLQQQNNPQTFEARPTNGAIREKEEHGNGKGWGVEGRGGDFGLSNMSSLVRVTR